MTYAEDQQTFTGLVIGGPRDGETVTMQTPRFTAHGPLTMRRMSGSDRAADCADDPPTEYHLIMGLRGETVIDFWVPRGRDAAWAFSQLFSGYEQRTAMKRRCRHDGRCFQGL